MNTPDVFKSTTDFIRNSATLKMLTIGFLVLLLLIPASMTESLVREREYRKTTVVEEINQKWGYSQTITGPFFTIPYKSFYNDERGNVKYNVYYLHILPREVNITGELLPQVRYRGIYEAVLYTAKLRIDGRFAIPRLSTENIDKDNVLWDKVTFSLGITDMRGIQENIEIHFNGEKYQATPGLLTPDIASSGIKSLVELTPNISEHDFSFELILNGSEQISFTPVGENTSVRLTSSWQSPSFNGSFLPVSREISKNGFSAEWKVLHLNRNYPQYWRGGQFHVSESSFGLRLLIVADIYQKTMRVSKYAIIFMVFTFSAFFFSEIINRKRVHPIQYMLIGLTIILFYVLLLSISEHISFGIAYLISASLITLIITGYSKGILKNPRFTLTVFCILVILYGYLYVVLQLEDYALLMGSIGLLIVLSTIMFITRKIDWYSLSKTQE